MIHFQQYILSWSTNPKSMISLFKLDYMGLVDFVVKVSISFANLFSVIAKKINLM